MSRLGAEATRLRFRVIALVDIHQPQGVLALIRAGAKAVIARDSPGDLLLAVIQAVRKGEVWVDPTGSMEAVKRLRASSARQPEDELTPRESDVLHLIQEGLDNRQIAEVLWITEQSVKAHVKRIRRKLGVTDRVQMVQRHAPATGRQCPNT